MIFCPCPSATRGGPVHHDRPVGPVSPGEVGGHVTVVYLVPLVLLFAITEKQRLQSGAAQPTTS